MYYYKRLEDDTIVSVESKSVNIASPDFVKATKAEYNAFIASMPTPEPEPPLVFNPSNPAHDPPSRIEHIEEFLGRAFP